MKVLKAECHNYYKMFGKLFIVFVSLLRFLKTLKIYKTT